jgi:hypothetical protein
MSNNKETTTLPVAARAQNALAGVTTEAELIKLAGAAKEITEITNSDGRKQCHATRMTLVNARLAITKAGKAAREDATAFSRAVIAEEKRLLAFIEGDEARLEKLQNDWDTAREAEKKAKEEAERQRVAKIREEIDRIKNRPVIAVAWGSEKLRAELAGLEAFTPDAETFQEFLQEACEARVAAVAAISGLLEVAIGTETEQARIAAEREELARLKAAEEQRQREEEARRAEEERQAREAREAEERAHRERMEAERRQQEEELRKQREEQERQAAEVRRQQEEEAARLAAQRAEIERQQREAEAAERRAQQERERAEREEAARAKLAESLEEIANRHGLVWQGTMGALQDAYELGRKHGGSDANT